MTKRQLLFSLFILTDIVVLSYIALAVYIGTLANQDTKVKSDAILVLGARSYLNGAYNPCLVARVDHAVNLYKEHYAPKLLFSGGYDKEDNASESETMKKIAMEKGVPEKDILLEKNSTSTYENFTYSQAILSKEKITSLIIVTEPFHIARASFIAQKLGMNATASPATESPCWYTWKYASRYFLKEPFAIAVYKLQNKL